MPLSLAARRLPAASRVRTRLQAAPVRKLRAPSKIAVLERPVPALRPPAGQLPQPPVTAAGSRPLGPDDFKVHTLKRKSPDDDDHDDGADAAAASAAGAATTAATAAPAAPAASAGMRKRAAVGANKPVPALAPSAARKPAAATTKRAAAATSSIRTASRPAAATRPAATGAASLASRRKPAASASAAVPAAAPAAEASASDERKDDDLIPKRKRPSWDTKGRLEDALEAQQILVQKLSTTEAQAAALRTELSESNTWLAALTATLTPSARDSDQRRSRLETQIRAKEDEIKLQKKAVAEAQQELANVVDEYSRKTDDMVKAHNGKVSALSESIEKLQSEHGRTTQELIAAQTEIAQLKTTVSAQTTANLALETSNRALKQTVEDHERTISDRDAAIAELRALEEKHRQTIAELEEKIREEELVRRRLHNTIQELKGNIRVFCRVRPALGTEADELGGGAGFPHINFSDKNEGVIELVQSAENAQGNKTISKTYPFTFDKVFQPSAKQADVFEEISQLVQSALDGYNVCIFAYGQTGSGKTFTMEGPSKVSGPDDPDNGMIPRAVQQIFLSAERLKAKGWEYTMEGQFLEIYNETIRDLLTADDGSKKHDIRHDHAKGRTTVTDVVNAVVKSPKEVFALLRKAGENRAVASTNCNERSSRSHSVFTLRLSGTNALTGDTSEGVLNLIDLAGSERLASSGSTGERLKETQAINKSLSSLGDVIFALSNKEAHIPYRNSKLTYLLQNSLGGNSKTLMFVNISPALASLQESLCSLRFATKVNSCQIGTARRQTVATASGTGK
nr:kinesin-like nuclear fusion protein [Polyrhizophydium stewartii]